MRAEAVVRNWSPFKNDENVYFILKAPFVLRMFEFLSYFPGHVEKWLGYTDRLISKFMTSQPGKQTISINIV